MRGNSLIDECVFFRNRRPAPKGSGGGLVLGGKGCYPAPTACWPKTTTGIYGGALVMKGARVESRTITRNSCFRQGRLIDGSGKVVNSIVWGNTVFSKLGDPEVVFENCCLERESGGSGNTVADPRFIDWRHGDYRLQDESPCAELGARGFWTAKRGRRTDEAMDLGVRPWLL